MFSRIAESVFKKRLASSPTLNETVNEAASQYMGKAAKIDTAVDGILADDLRELAKADRERVAAYAAAKVPGVSRSPKSKESKMPGDFIICDDYRKGTGTLPAVIMGVVATAALGVGGLGLWAAIASKSVPPVVEVVDTDTQYLLELVPGDDSL